MSVPPVDHLPSLDPHSRTVLEYDRLLLLLRRRAPGALGQNAISALLPVQDVEEVRRLQRETAQMRLLNEETEIGWGGSRDISAELDDLKAKGSWIEPPRFLKTTEFAETAAKAKKVIERAGRMYPDLNSLAAPIPEYSALISIIRKAITAEGELAEDASPELAAIRRRLEGTRRDLIALLERFFTNRHSAAALQEPIVTKRNERYVIPVKAGSRGAVPGLIHDRSSSGQTLFIEPHSAVEKNNTLKELIAMEREEVLRILRALGDAVREHSADLEGGMGAMGALEAVFAKARYAVERDCVEPEIFDEEGMIDLHGAWHPLLIEVNGQKPVPMDFALGGVTTTLVLTGPNTGGKTVALKTIGLLSLMAQSGLQIPALPGSGLSCFAEVFADIGDEQSIEQSLSTFSGHMKNLIGILGRTRRGTLVLLDELGAGTDPSEGAALGMAILEEVHASGALTVTTTHHNALKVFAEEKEGVDNASMEFDSRTLEPTYRLVTGIPGRSQAFHVAAGLGLDGRIIDRGRQHQTSGEVRLDSLMAHLEEERAALLEKGLKLDEERRRLDDREGINERKWEKKREKLEKIASETVRQGKKELAEALHRLKKEKTPLAVTAAQASVEKIRRAVADIRPPRPSSPPDLRTLLPGNEIFVRSLMSWGKIESLEGKAVMAMFSGKRCSIPLSAIGEIRVGGGKNPGKEKNRAMYAVEKRGVESSRIDLRGLRGDEAYSKLERFIEDALLSGLPRVTILHGKGEGRLREVVRALLSEHARVDEFGDAPLSQGGAGVTIAALSS